MSRYPDAYAVCPVCGIHIDIQALKDEESFTGEEATRHIEDAHPEVCTDLGVPYFSIHLSDSPPPKPKRQGPYTDTELRAVFTMARLLLLLDGIEDLPKMNKRAMLRVLMAGPCPTRSRGSLEAKLMNVSGASERIGGPTIPGYKPAPNCQKIMVEIARTTLIENSDEHIDLAVYVALMQSQSRALQDAAFQPGLLADKLVGLLADFVEASP